jgi:hypothetical protein
MLSLLLCSFCLLSSVFCLPPSSLNAAQQPRNPAPVIRPKLPRPEPSAPPTSEAAPADSDAVLPGDWAPELLYSILNSKNPDAAEALYDAAFAAGPNIIPQLQAALKDDRTAEFAAQSLADIGGAQSLLILAGLMGDKRDLDLRRFYLGSLGEYSSPEADKVLFYALNHSDSEPDRTVTEAAILALTVRSDASLIPEIRQAQSKITDVVIHDDLSNALQVIQLRARYLASPEGQKAGGSLQEAVRTYFMPALEPAPAVAHKPPARPAAREGIKYGPSPSGHSGQSAPAPEAKVEVQSFTLSPDKTRALAHVVFEDPTALAYYDMVLQKRLGNWTVVSVWLGPEIPEPAAASEQGPDN